MQLQTKRIDGTKIQLIITADQTEMESAKQQVLQALNRTQVKVQGFRAGKAPLALVEKHVDQSVLQSDFLDNLINKLYIDAVTKEDLRPVANPDVTVKKFVPFTTLEIELTVEVLGKIVLSDYKKIRLPKTAVSVTDKDVTDVVEALRTRAAEKKEVKRAAAKNDEVEIDFAGTDAKTNEPIQGGEGKAYPLILGSDSFIPGFEDNLIGVKAGEEKTFTLTFPKEYGVKTLQNRKVTFKTTIHKVTELVKPKVDDAFAAKAGPFKSLSDLKADIKKQLTIERTNESDRAYESQLLEKIVEQSTIPLPQTIVNEELERLLIEEKQSLTYRGQTWQEYLSEQGLSEEAYRTEKRPIAENRVKAGLVLREVAEKENIQVSDEELVIRLQQLKSEYQDKQMQAELDKPENQRDITGRMTTEKTIAKLVGYATL